MKRDMDLIRQILLDLEADVETAPGRYDLRTIFHHKALLVDAGLVTGTTYHEGSDYKALVGHLTWDGHEFLDAARDETGWKAVMKKVGESAGTTSMAVIQAMLIEFAKGRFL
jgi:hypothetical protein